MIPNFVKLLAQRPVAIDQKAPRAKPDRLLEVALEHGSISIFSVFAPAERTTGVHMPQKASLVSTLHGM
jgi:hypothetical protein